MSDHRPADHILDEFLGKHGVRVTVGEFTKVLRDMRGSIAEEIAFALDERALEWRTPTPTPEGWDSHHVIVRGANQTALTRAAGVAREIGGLS